MSESGWFCPKCGRDRRVPYDDGKLVPCCNPKCKGKWGTGCYCCHHPKFLEKAQCTCDENCDDPCPVHQRENELQDRAIEAENEVKRLTELYEREFDKRTAIRRWWRGNTKIVKNRLTVDDQALADLRELIADHSFDEAVDVRTKDQRIRALKEELAEKDDRISDLEAVLNSEKLQHEETRGYRQKAEKNLRAVSAALHAYPDSDLKSLAKLYHDVYTFRMAKCDSGDCETLEMYRASAIRLNDELERLRKPKIDS